MSRTHKDTPRDRDRRTAERPFPYTPAAVPVGATWEAIAETAIATPGPVRGHTPEQRILELLADADIIRRAELTAIANS